MRLREYRALGQSYVELAAWEGSASWIGTSAAGTTLLVIGTTLAPGIHMFGPISRVSTISYQAHESGKRKFVCTSDAGNVTEEELRRWKWFFRQCVPESMHPTWWPDYAWPVRGNKPLSPVASGSERAGVLSAGFDPEPYVLLDELHPVWTGDRSWLQLPLEAR